MLRRLQFRLRNSQSLLFPPRTLHTWRPQKHRILIPSKLWKDPLQNTPCPQCLLLRIPSPSTRMAAWHGLCQRQPRRKCRRRIWISCCPLSAKFPAARSSPVPRRISCSHLRRKQSVTSLMRFRKKAARPGLYCWICIPGIISALIRITAFTAQAP